MTNTFQQRENSGALFKNDKGGNESRPDYRGDLNVEGETYEVAAWIKEGKNGKFMSLSIKPKEERQAAPKRQAPPPPRRGGDMDDGSDVPF